VAPTLGELAAKPPEGVTIKIPACAGIINIIIFVKIRM